MEKRYIFRKNLFPISLSCSEVLSVVVFWNYTEVIVREPRIMDFLTLHWPMATKVPLIKFAKCTPNQVS